MTPVAPSTARRMLDVVVAAFGLLVGGVPLLILMLGVRMTSRGPALFTQVRLGEGARPFVMYKLRTMRAGAHGPDVTAIADARVTRIGQVLRRTSLDELPQLWNVLRGDMTLVGPRPETPGLASRYPQDCQWVFGHRPGLTGPAQVRLRDAQVLAPGAVVDEQTYLCVLVPARTAVDAGYLENPTLTATLGVLVDTVRHLMGRPTPDADTSTQGHIAVG
jgi:lipopolysaccharide/colanic/teichoic acid biosynthesis glycosyltransferase